MIDGKPMSQYLEEAKKEQAEAFQQISKNDHLNEIRGPSWDQWLDDLKNQPDPLDIGLRLPKEGGGEGNPLLLPGVGLSGVFACTGHGKSTFLLNAAANMLEMGKRVVYYGYEEARTETYTKLALRFGYHKNGELLKPVNKGPAKAIKAHLKGQPIYPEDVFESEEHQSRMQEGLDKVRKYTEEGALIVSSSDMREPTAQEFAQDIKVLMELPKEKRPDIIMLDYLQLMTAGEEFSGGSRQYEMKEICQILRRTANESSIPILVAGQFNRQADVNEDYLELSKIGEAGDIERVLSFAIGLWNHNRPRKKKPEGATEEGDSHRDLMTVKVLKNREGGTPRPFMLKTQLANYCIDFQGVPTEKTKKQEQNNKTKQAKRAEQIENERIARLL